MKRTLLFISLLFAVVLTVSAQDKERGKGRRPEGTPDLTLERTEHDFGKIDEQGKKVTCEFEFTNMGDCPLVITRASVSCKCIDVSYSKKTVPAGGKSLITISYNPKKQQGVFYKAIQIYSNDPDKMHIVKVKGEVVVPE